ncbi:MAG: hypothetical protein K9G36_10950 [Crocinitomicaceae bacterium]|nr:hypothetical protein [Crocinitomicaceae bacterium]
MKKIIGSLSLVLFIFGATAQEKQTVHSVVVEWRDVEWYKTQEKLWKAEIDKNKKNNEAWMNYYSAVRAIRNCSYDNQKELKLYTELGHKIANDLFATLPESFEANYIMYWDRGLGDNDEKYLAKAYQLKPNDPRVLLDYLINSEIKRDKETFSRVAKKLFEINRISSGALNWGYNVLTEVSENGIVFTAGDNDTYALWIVQEALNYRKDVTVINTSMIQLDDYRAKLFKEKGIAPFDFDKNELFETKLFKHIFENNAKISVHVSTSASAQFTDTTITENLYLTGLTYIYSKVDVENIAVIKRNFEKRFLLDHLTKTFSYSYGDLDSRIKHMYLPGLMKLYFHSKTADDLEGIVYYKGLIDAIAKELKIEAEIHKALAE